LNQAQRNEFYVFGVSVSENVKDWEAAPTHPRLLHQKKFCLEVRHIVAHVLAGAQAGIPLCYDAGYRGWQIFQGATQLTRCLLYDCKIVLGHSRGAASTHKFQPEIPLGLREFS
jgi:hypothetical protein